MSNFNLGGLEEWKPALVGDLIEFDAPPDGFRAVRFDVVCDQRVSAYAVTSDGETWLVGAGEGQFSCRFTIQRTVALSFASADADAVIYIRSPVDSQVIGESSEATFTTIEPRQAGPSDEVRRMMMIMQLNQKRREDALRAEFAAQLEASREVDPVIEREPAPAQKEAPGEVAQ